MTALNDQLRLEIESTNPPNPLENPTGSKGDSGWTAIGSTGIPGIINADTSGTPVAVDGFSLKVTGVGVNGYEAARSNEFPIDVGQFAGAQVSIYRPPGSVGQVQCALSVLYIDSAGTRFASASSAAYLGTGTLTLDYTRADAVPAGYVAAQVQVEFVNGLAAGDHIWFGKVAAKTASTRAGSAVVWSPPTYTEVIGQTLSARWSQGNELDGVEDKIQPGLLTARVKGATVDPAANPAIYRGRRVRLSALSGGAWVPQFTGVIETLNTTYDDSKTVVTLTATDAGAALTRTPLDVCGTASLKSVLTWDVARAANVAVDDGQGNGVNPGDGDNASYAQGSYVADWLRRACNTFGGYAWVDKSNVVKARLRADLPAAVTTFSDDFADVGATYYSGIDASFSSEALVNTLTVKRINVDEGEEYNKDYGPYQAPASIAKWGSVPGEVEILDGTPLTIATALLRIFATPTIYPRSITFEATDDISKAIGLTLYQRILVKRAALINTTYRLIKVTHDVAATADGDKWLTTIELRPLETSLPTVSVVPPALGADTGPEDTLPPTPRDSLSSYATGVTVVWFDIRRSGKWREIRGGVNRNLATGSTNISTAIPVDDRPSRNVFANCYVAGGNVGVAFIRPDGTIALNNMSGAARSGDHQFTLIYSVD